MKACYSLWYYGWRDVPFVCNSEFLFLVAWQMISNKRMMPHRIMMQVSNKCVKLTVPKGEVFTDGTKQFAKFRIPVHAVALSTVGPYPRDNVVAILMVPIKNVSSNAGVLVFRCDSAETAAAAQYSMQKMIRHHHDSSFCPFLGHQYSYIPQPGSGVLSDRCPDPISYWKQLMQHQAVITELKSRFRCPQSKLLLDDEGDIDGDDDTTDLLLAGHQPFVVLRRTSNSDLIDLRPLPLRLFGETVRWRRSSPAPLRPTSTVEDDDSFMQDCALAKCRSVDVLYEHF
ncbi:unnamed protein product [Soboliphyme baturini]|uniref:RHD_dimer domain-containing protein n=1 Tax=Soboliphyme baturini TaxID=241478 RepID=A0A183IPV2_9BILA|nr:unnamed protein product [Soboliphyme baturini]